MVRLNLAAVEKRIAKIEQRARLLNLPPLTTVDVRFNWNAFLDADVATREQMRQAYEADVAASVEPPMPDDPRTVATVVVCRYVPDEANLWRYESGDEDQPTNMSPAEYAAALARRDEMVRQMQAEAAVVNEPADDRDPVDLNPDGDPEEVLYIDQRSGWPVRRREHQARRERQREADIAAEWRRKHAAATGGYTTFERGQR